MLAGLTVEQAKEAAKGAEYASNEYEKWKTAYKQAKKDLDATLARHAEERKDLAEEREVIKEIMRYLGVLHDVKATEKSIAAGGKDSTIDPETGVSEVKAMSTAKLQVLLPSRLLRRDGEGEMRKLSVRGDGVGVKQHSTRSVLLLAGIDQEAAGLGTQDQAAGRDLQARADPEVARVLRDRGGCQDPQADAVRPRDAPVYHQPGGR